MLDHDGRGESGPPPLARDRATRRHFCDSLSRPGLPSLQPRVFAPWHTQVRGGGSLRNADSSSLALASRNLCAARCPIVAPAAYISEVIKGAGRKGATLPAIRHACEANIPHYKKGLFTASMHHMLEKEQIHRMPRHFNTFRLSSVAGTKKKTTARVRAAASDV